MSAELARHVGHRTTLLDVRRLRCVDCTQTVLLPSVPGSTSTSSSPIPGPGDPLCPTHGRYAGTCRGCAADTKADEARVTNWQPTADVTARANEARAALTRRQP